jgi:hypothetical protein
MAQSQILGYKYNLNQAATYTDGFDIGIVLAPALDAATLTDLTVKYQSVKGGQFKTADVTAPEPAVTDLRARRGRPYRFGPTDAFSARRATARP